MKNAIISVVSTLPTVFACMLIYTFPASSAVSGGSTGTSQPTGGDPALGGVAATYEPPPVGGPSRTTGSGTRRYEHRGSGRLDPTKPA
jgi:hypothetical protein